jgi:hypothetical protein
MVRAEVSAGRELTAAVKVLNSPAWVPDPRTTTAPLGGAVRAIAYAPVQNKKSVASVFGSIA